MKPGRRTEKHKTEVQSFIRENYFLDPGRLANELGITRYRVLEIIRELRLRPKDLQFRSNMARPPAEYSNRNNF